MHPWCPGLHHFRMVAMSIEHPRNRLKMPLWFMGSRAFGAHHLHGGCGDFCFSTAEGFFGALNCITGGSARTLVKGLAILTASFWLPCWPNRLPQGLGFSQFVQATSASGAQASPLRTWKAGQTDLGRCEQLLSALKVPSWPGAPLGVPRKCWFSSWFPLKRITPQKGAVNLTQI